MDCEWGFVTRHDGCLLNFAAVRQDCPWFPTLNRFWEATEYWVMIMRAGLFEVLKLSHIGHIGSLSKRLWVARVNPQFPHVAFHWYFGRVLSTMWHKSINFVFWLTASYISCPASQRKFSNKSFPTCYISQLFTQFTFHVLPLSFSWAWVLRGEGKLFPKTFSFLHQKYIP